MPVKCDAGCPSPDLHRRLESLIHPPTRTCLGRYARADTRTLEVGCGPGQYRLAVPGRYVGVDLTAEPYKEGLPRLVDVLADAQAIPFCAATFDLVFFSNTFHYFPNGLEVLKQCIQLLKPAGWLLILDYSQPTLERLDRSYAVNYPGWRAYGRNCAQWVRLFEDAGLIDVELWTNTVSWKARLVRALLPRVLYFRCIDQCTGSIVTAGQRP